MSAWLSPRVMLLWLSYVKCLKITGVIEKFRIRQKGTITVWHAVLQVCGFPLSNGIFASLWKIVIYGKISKSAKSNSHSIACRGIHMIDCHFVVVNDDKKSSYGVQWNSVVWLSLLILVDQRARCVQLMCGFS